jgi:ribosome biogenesis GTPase / thiamine phosphate phosphatase
MSKKKKVRVELRKNRGKPPRETTWTRQFQEHGFEDDKTVQSERVRAKGDLSRHRTIIQEDLTKAESREVEGNSSLDSMPETSVKDCLRGRVIRVHGLQSVVDAEDGKTYRCAVRRLLKSMMTDERNVITCGDRVWFRPSGDEGMIEKVDNRKGVLTRASRRREHVLVSNVDQLIIVISLVQPDLKPHLIDRYLASAEQGGLKPILVLNKADLVEPARLQSLLGAYAQLGIPAFLTSVRTGVGIDQLRMHLSDRASVFSGQSGVGKSSLLNAIQPDLALRVRTVSEVNQKGRHTTTTAELIKLETGGWVVDTPGVRQLQLWNIIPEEVEGFFPEFRPYVALCGFPDCTHQHEHNCAVQQAVRRRHISPRRFHSYLGMYNGALELE